MAKKWKILIAFAVIAVVVTGIAVPIALYGDGVGEIIAGNKIYTAEHVKQAQQVALSELEAERQKTREIIADYEKKLVEKEAFWQDKYDKMVAEKDAEIARLRGLLEEARGTIFTMQEAVTRILAGINTGDFASEYNVVDFYEIVEELSFESLLDYNAELDKLPTINELDNSIYAKRQEIIYLRNNLSVDDKEYYTFWDIIYNHLSVEIGENGEDVYLTNPLTNVRNLILKNKSTSPNYDPLPDYLAYRTALYEYLSAIQITRINYTGGKYSYENGTTVQFDTSRPLTDTFYDKYYSAYNSISKQYYFNDYYGHHDGGGNYMLAVATAFHEKGNKADNSRFVTLDNAYKTIANLEKEIPALEKYRSEVSYQIGWLDAVIKQAEGALSSARTNILLNGGTLRTDEEILSDIEKRKEEANA